MSDRKDRKLQEVAIAEYRYRHEADFAAGFLAEAGIPYRLQVDDAGGADLGLSALRPSVLWVRAVDADAARAVLAHEVLEEPEEVERHAELAPLPWEEFDPASAWGASLPAAGASATDSPSRRSRAGGAKLSVGERVLALVLAGVSLAALLLLPGTLPWVLRVGAPVALGLLLLSAAALGRAPGFVAGTLRALTGGAP